jgi:hypothetical protein
MDATERQPVLGSQFTAIETRDRDARAGQPAKHFVRSGEIQLGDAGVQGENDM